jgi:NAD(P)-dependent dehydrogenase (short-subunit alcohol dehydrogenase family)
MSFEFKPDLRGKRVLITGASNETGPFVAREFARLGCKLALTCHSDKEALRRVEDECRELGASDCRSFQLDLLDSERCGNLVSEITRDGANIDVLVAVAGAGASYKSLVDLSGQELLRAFQGQVAGNFEIARNAAGYMPEDGNGRIVLISATSCYKYSHAGYGYTKDCLNELTKFLAYELSEKRITVNTLVPQLIDLESISQEVKDKRRKFTPLGNIPHPEQIARMAVVLSSPLFDIVTGQLIYMDGGYKLRPPEDR